MWMRAGCMDRQLVWTQAGLVDGQAVWVQTGRVEAGFHACQSVNTDQLGHGLGMLTFTRSRLPSGRTMFRGRSTLTP